MRAFSFFSIAVAAASFFAPSVLAGAAPAPAAEVSARSTPHDVIAILNNMNTNLQPQIDALKLLSPTDATQDVINELLEAYREVIDDTAEQITNLGNITGIPPIAEIATILGTTAITLCDALVSVASQLSDSTFILIGVAFSGLSASLIDLIQGLYNIIEGLEDAIVPFITSFLPILKQFGLGDVATALGS